MVTAVDLAGIKQRAHGEFALGLVHDDLPAAVGASGEHVVAVAGVPAVVTRREEDRRVGLGGRPGALLCARRITLDDRAEHVAQRPRRPLHPGDRPPDQVAERPEEGPFALADPELRVVDRLRSLPAGGGVLPN